MGLGQIGRHLSVGGEEKAPQEFKKPWLCQLQNEGCKVKPGVLVLNSMSGHVVELFFIGGVVVVVVVH